MILPGINLSATAAGGSNAIQGLLEVRKIASPSTKKVFGNKGGPPFELRSRLSKPLGNQEEIPGNLIRDYIVTLYPDILS